MPPLSNTRKGWINEHQAASLLSSFSFIAEPSKIGDDIGVDYFCTIFNKEKQKKYSELAPRDSFAIQIKSDKKSINADKKIDFFRYLALPLFIGVIDGKNTKLEIYSVEYIQPFLAMIGSNIKKLRFVPKPKENFGLKSYYHEKKKGSGHYFLDCPYVETFNAIDSEELIEEKTKKLQIICKRTISNIVSRISELHLYDMDGSPENHQIIYGEGSFRHFRQNFLKTLAVAFCNLNWALNNRFNIVGFNFNALLAEFNAYEACYFEMKKLDFPEPNIVSQVYYPLKAKLEGK